MCDGIEYIEPLEWPETWPTFEEIEKLRRRIDEALMLPKEFSDGNKK